MKPCRDSADKDEKKVPVRGEKPRDGKPPKKSPEEKGVESANDFMRKFIKKSEGA
jgi:hypothetical protein